MLKFSTRWSYTKVTPRESEPVNFFVGKYYEGMNEISPHFLWENLFILIVKQLWHLL